MYNEIDNEKFRNLELDSDLKAEVIADSKKFDRLFKLMRNLLDELCLKLIPGEALTEADVQILLSAKCLAND